MAEEEKIENKEMKVEEKKSKSAVEAGKTKKSKKKEEEVKIELEREYIVPLKKEVLKAPRYRRAKKAVKVLKEFLARHMRVENRDLNKVKVNIHLNNELWFRGIKKPMNKIKVKAIKKGGIVYAELADVPEVVKFKIAREEKKVVNVKVKEKTPKKDEVFEDQNNDGVDDKIEVEESKKASVEAGLKEAKVEKHTTKAKGGKAENAGKKLKTQTKK